jgi:hypothetical protein
MKISPIYAKYLRKRDEKPFIMLLGNNVLREIISYLTLYDFIEFATTCKKFSKFFYDKFIKHRISFENQLEFQPAFVLEPFLEIKAFEAMNSKLFPASNLLWKPFPITIFHFAVYDSRKFVFLYSTNTIEIREIVSFSCELTSIYSKQFGQNIVKAKGFKNKVFVLMENTVESFAFRGRN